MVTKLGTIGNMVKSSNRNMDKMFKTVNESKSIDMINIEDIMAQIGENDVLVGIPAVNSSRDGEGITNAELAFMHTHGIRSKAMAKEMEPTLTKSGSYSKAYQLYIQSHGSPAYRVPPRPIIEPAIEANIEMLANKLKKAVGFFLEGQRENALAELERAGLSAQNYVRGWFVDPRNNWPPNSPATIKKKGSDRPLIDTGELRKSITYVMRSNDSEKVGKINVKKETKLGK